MTDLDYRQQAAVDAGPVDVFISAGAGSGKTRVLAARFTNAVLGLPPYGEADPESLLTVTFTEKAAAELAERIRGSLIMHGRPEAARRLSDTWIATIHGMCSRILRQNALQAGLDPQFHVLDITESSVLEAQAEEEAFRTAMASDPEAVALIDAYGLTTVSAALHEVHGGIRALGCRARDISIIDAGTVKDKLKGISQELTGIAGAFGSLRQIATVTNGIETIRKAEVVIEGLCSGELTSSDALKELTSRGLVRRTSVEGLNDLVDEAKALIEEGRLCAAQLAVAKYERAFLSLLGVFEMCYADLKREKGVLDFEDLQTETVRLLDENLQVAEYLRSRFSMVMIDEFQDTNALQLQITARIARENLTTVGDENQSIYAFRYADVEVFRQRAREVGVQHKLDINYRITAPLLEVLNKLFAHPALFGSGFMALSSSSDRATHFMWPTKRPRFEARFIDWSDPQGADSHEAEAECVADTVTAYIRDGVAPGEIAVLMGAMSGRAQFIEHALRRRGIAVVLASGGTFFECLEIMEARALLRLIDNVWDDRALVSVLSGRLVGLSPDALSAIRVCADSASTVQKGAEKAHLWDVIMSDNLELGEEDGRALRLAVAVVERARCLRGLRSLKSMVLEPLLELDADLVYFRTGMGSSRAWANILKLAALAAEYESAAAGDLRGFLNYLDVRELHAINEQEATLENELGAVRVMSIHASKGLEFPVVVVAGLSGATNVPAIAVRKINGGPLLGMRLPTGEKPFDTTGWKCVAETERASREAESKRLLYVACTRAQEALTVVARTKPNKEADTSIVGALRRSLGLGEEGAFAVRGIVAGGVGVKASESARISLVEPQGAGAAEEEKEGGSSLVVQLANNGAESDSKTAEIKERLDSLAASCNGAKFFKCCDEASALSERKMLQLVSYSSLATYESCPYRYYLLYVARLAPPLCQSRPALAFGSAVHVVLERYRDPANDLGELLEQAIVATGMSPEETPRLNRAVREYLSSSAAADVHAAERVMREAPIAVPIGGSVLTGAIDVLAWNGTEALIVDYKTGNSDLLADDARERYRLQGMCYALAAFAAGATSVRVVFAEIERQRETSYEYTAGDHAMIEDAVTAIISRIAQAQFEPRMTYEPHVCEACPGLGTVCSVVKTKKRSAR